MTEPIRVVVEGVPVGKGRPRFVRATGAAYTPEKTANYEAVVSWTARAAMNGQPPLGGPLSVSVSAFMPIPASWPKKRIFAARSGKDRPTRPDADNLLKLGMDALNGVIWADDRQVARAVVEKQFSDRPRLEIEVKGLNQ